jgi:tetratricopeptide (TPR) repeat protein
MPVDFDLVNYAIDADENERAKIITFLKQNRDKIEDEAVLGFLDYLERNPEKEETITQAVSEIDTILYYKPKRNPKIFFSIAAAILILIIGGGLFMYLKPSADIFEPEEFGLDNMLSENNLTSQWDSFNKAYHDKKYREAIGIMNRLPKNTAKDSLLYFKGVSFMKIEEYENAAKQFHLLIQENQSVFYQDAEYLYAISLIKQGDIKKAKSALGSIVKQPHHPFQKEAEALMKDFF